MIESTARQLLAQMSGGAVSAEAVTVAFLHSIRSRDPHTRAFLHLDADGALEPVVARLLDLERERARLPLRPALESGELRAREDAELL